MCESLWFNQKYIQIYHQVRRISIKCANERARVRERREHNVGSETKIKNQRMEMVKKQGVREARRLADDSI